MCLLCAESRDLACTVGEVAVREAGFPGDHVAADLLAPEVIVAVAVEPSKEVARAS